MPTWRHTYPAPAPRATVPTFLSEAVRNDGPDHVQCKINRRHWVYAMIGIGFFLYVTIGLVTGSFESSPTTTPATTSPAVTASVSALPECIEEDGSTQQACVWSDGTGSTINMSYGRYSYDVTNNTIHDWTQE